MYQIKFSGRFKKSYKLCIKRGLNPELMSNALRSWQKLVLCHQSCFPTRFMVIMRGVWNVTFNLIGFSFGKSTRINCTS
jgi:hypothetical protein